MDIPFSAPEGRRPIPAIIPPAAPTATAATAMIWGATELTEGQKRKLSTAITCAVEALRPGEDPKLVGRHVLMNCATLGPLLRRTAAQLGKTEDRFTSLCSEWRRVLRYFGQHEPNRRGQALASPALQVFSDALPKERQHALVDFLRFLDAANMELHDVRQETCERYLQQIATRTLRRNPDARPKQVASAWNWACKHIQGWPDIELVVPTRKPKGTPPGIPASFWADLDRYADRLSGDDAEDIFLDDIFSEENAESVHRQGPRRPATIRNKRWLLSGVTNALLVEGLDPGELRSLMDLLQPEERPKTAIRHYVNKFKGTQSTMPFKIAEELRLLARDYCGLPKKAVDRIATWVKRVRKRFPQQAGMTRKNATRLRALMQFLPRAMLLGLSAELMRRARAEESKPDPDLVEAAELVMYAVIVEILLICVLRRGNLARLRLDRDLHRPDPTKGRITHIFVPPHEAKTRKAIEWPLPRETAKLIETYIWRYRPHLAAEGNPFLFPGRGTQSRYPQGIARWISATVARDIGVEFNMHLARHFAAWNFLCRYPGQYEIVRQALGHEDVKTTRTFYLGLEADAAAAHFDSAVLKDRPAMQKIAAQAFRKGRGGLGPRSRGR